MTQVVEECCKLDFNCKDKFNLACNVATHIRCCADDCFHILGIHFGEEPAKECAEVDVTAVDESCCDVDCFCQGDTVKFGDFGVFLEVLCSEVIFVL